MTQLLEVWNKTGFLQDSRKQSDVILLDMSETKMFDKVNHALLICKLGQCNIGRSLLNWFLLPKVTALAATSSSRAISSGVPQGSIQQLLALLMILKYSVASSLMLSYFSLT